MYYFCLQSIEKDASKPFKIGIRLSNIYIWDGKNHEAFTEDWCQHC